MTTVNLFTLMRDHFNLAEIQSLTFNLGVDYEEFPPLGKSQIIISLIKYCHQNGKIPNLLAHLKEERSFLPWPNPHEAHQLDFLLGNDIPKLRPYEPETVVVTAGEFIMGDNEKENASPQHKVFLDLFWIGKYPITNRQYFEFVRKANYDVPNKRDWFLGQPIKDKLNHPVVGVNWYDANEYCKWLSRETSKQYRLPSEAQWEKAARGPNGHNYPWGDEWQDGLCHQGHNAITSVTTYDDTTSYYDCKDLIGNIQQWTSTIWGNDRKIPTFSYPYQNDERETIEADDNRFRLRRVVRGSVFNDNIYSSRLTTRHNANPNQATLMRGFRVILQA